MASQFSAFAPFGTFRFSSRKPYAERIYETLQATQGDAFSVEWEGEQAKRLFATAMCLGAAQLQQERAANAGDPERATETLPLLESDYGVVPRRSASLNERRQELAAAFKAHKGARYDSIFDGLTALLGADLIEIIVRDIPTPSGANLPGTFPGTVDPDQGQANFAPADKLSQVLETIHGVTTLGVPVAIGYDYLFGEETGPKVGEKLVIDPGKTGLTECVTVTICDGSSLAATFTKPHAVGARMTSAPFPYWLSIRRHWAIVVAESVTQDPILLAKVHKFLGKAMRGVSIWDICIDNGDGTSGPFEVAAGIIGHTPIEELSF
jgi:hypothetical protein